MQCLPNITTARWNAPDVSRPRRHTGCVAHSADFVGRFIRCRADSSDTRVRDLLTLLPEVWKPHFARCAHGYGADLAVSGNARHKVAVLGQYGSPVLTAT